MTPFCRRGRVIFSLIFWLSIGPVFLTFAATPPQQAKDYRLVFSDDFDTLDLSPDGRGTHAWYEGVWFSRAHAPLANFSIHESALTIAWTRGQPQPDSSITTFSLKAPSYHAWRYGYFEARCKWTPVRGAWPAFWLIPIQAAYSRGSDQPPESGEIDVFEGQGTEPDILFGTIHHWRGAKDLGNSGNYNRFPLPKGAEVSQYHKYGLLWVPGRITWFFDDIPLHSEPTYDVFDRQDYFLILGMDEGANWKEGDLTGVDVMKLTLTIDWVRVWQK